MAQASPAPQPTSKTTLIVIFGMMALFLGVLGLFFWGKIADGYHALKLQSNSQSIRARTTDMGFSRHSSRYAFEVNGMTYTGRGSTASSTGDIVDVVYDPADPSINRPADSLTLDIVLAAAMIFGLPLLIVFAILRQRFTTKPAS